MATNIMEIELDKLKEELANLNKIYENVQDTLNKSKTEFDRVSNYWNGDCGDVVNGGLSNFTKNYKSFEDILKNYIVNLEDSITEYEAANNELKVKADKNLSEQPSGLIS